MQSMSFRGKDRYGNPVLLNPKEWCLNVCKSSEQPEEKDESVMIIVPKRTSDEFTLCFSFYFETKGVYKVNIMQKGKCVQTQFKDDVTFPKSVVFEARQAPLDPKKCRIASSNKSKVAAGRKIKMRVELYDRYGKPFILDECEESMDKFCVKLNDVQNRKDSLKLFSSRSHVCELEWNPTLAGLHNYVVYYNDKKLGEETFDIHVNPRPLKSVEVVQSYSLFEETVAAPPLGTKIPEFCSKEFGVFENTSYIDRSFYTNEKQFMSFQGKDKYGNLVVLNPEEWCLNVRKDDTNLDVNNAFQETKSEDSTLCFSYCFNAKGTYSVSLKRRDTTGNSKDGEDLPKPLVFNVLPAPLDHSKCRITSSHNLDTIAGEKVHLNVELFDIFEKPFMLEELEESIHKFSLKIIGVENGEESLRLLSSGGHGCELEWTPTLAGRHIFQIYFDGRVLGKESVTIAVNPGSLRSILVLETQSSFVEGTNKFLCLTNEKKTLFLKGCDEFENDVSVDSEQWYLRAESEDGISVNLDQEQTLDGPILKFFFRFNTEGTYNVHMQHIDGDNADIAIPKGFKVIVDTAPLDPEKCSSQHMDAEKPIFAQPSVPLKFKIELFDCMSNPFDSSKVKKEALHVKVNGEVIAHFLEPCESLNTVLIVVNVDTRDKDFVDFTTEYQQITVAKPITIKVTGVSPYEELDYINVSPDSMLINIFNVSHRQLIGEDFANIDNINRALKLWHIRCSDFVVMRDPVDGNFAQLYYEEIVDKTQFYWNDEKTKCELSATSKLLSLLAESIHYRTRAYEMDHEREQWKGKSEDAYKSQNYEEAKECSGIKEKYSRLMDEAHDKASRAIFAFFNYNRTEKEIDLHGQLVADEDKLKKYENQLRRKFNSTEVKKKVQQARSKMDEAINHLQKRLASQEEHQLDWLEIIVGAGRHSNDNRQKIRPKVETFLKNNNLGFTECNKGSLLISYKEYKGKQPCYASFYCKKCDKSWESRSSWKDYWQMCFKCDRKGVESKCYPLKLRSASGSQKRTNRSGISSGPTFTPEDHKRLCQKCQELPDDVYCDD